jgi:acyl carrier protein
MYDDQLTNEVRAVMAETFGVDQQDLPIDISQETYAPWTSLLQMVLLVALEEQFDITFTMDEMTSMTSLERIIAVLQTKQRVGSAV